MTGGRLPEASDPYRLSVESDRSGVAEYFVDEVRSALLLDQVDPGPCDGYLMPGPAVPLSFGAGDGTASFDGDRVVLDWNWTTEEAKRSVGPCEFRVADVRAVDWYPSKGLDHGWLRFTLAGAPSAPAPKYDRCAVELFGFKKDPLMALVAAAVAVRMPHPAAPGAGPGPAKALPLAESGPALAGEAADHDTLLRRLREVGELHQAGILTADEFSAAKAAILGRF